MSEKWKRNKMVEKEIKEMLWGEWRIKWRRRKVHQIRKKEKVDMEKKNK